MPDEATRDFLLRNLESTMLMHPCFNFPQFRNRVEALYNPDIWTATSPSSELDLAQPDVTGESGDPQPSTTSPRRPSLSFFAAALAGLALGAYSTSTLPPPTLPTQSSSDRPILNGFSPLPANVSADSFFTLSKQVLAVSEWNSNYDLDFIIAVILNGLYLLHDGKSSIAHTIFPSIGKLVNIAKMMGLHLDPDDFPGRYSLFDAEMRRRVWWDVYYYDLFMSDSMGQHPLIDDEMCTTRLPADVDEEKFHEGSQSLPAPRERSNFAYFIQKCR
ncbi:uncharacterized protein EI90DRAFT_2911917 [Cantharellus anzutake]|uniref:uncharacterized protein n=1 Tax=Cantharellus anzutake TaxID=1750568 RepID=UPI001902E0BD|nr:uncharacterized protein EI90DRAFT_2911917 [Cantharellus anzutake]KAF8336273.1 hypothetical protein EI90DRAFT_2911917 [Cantharellus anzutake]